MVILIRYTGGIKIEKYFLSGLLILLLLSSSLVGVSNSTIGVKQNIVNIEQANNSYGGQQEHSWPMFGYDAKHTGRSPYSTADNPGDEIWQFKLGGMYINAHPVIDDQGVIYMGEYYFNAIYPNGTLKWRYNELMVFQSAAAIDENGIIYVGSSGGVPSDYLFAFYPDGIVKWKYETKCIHASPTIGNDGTIYFGEDGNQTYPFSGYINALYPNGTLRWRYKTDHFIYSSPAISDDGILYCGSVDNHIYALYANNGTLKWKYKTGNWIHGSPTIGDDGTVYCGSDDKYLYAFYPNNGTIKWKLKVGAIGGYIAFDEDGTLYFGVYQEKFYAIYPNGTVKWEIDLGENNGVWDSSAAISYDGTIYFGMHYNHPFAGQRGDLVALNPDGTIKWRREVKNVHSSPAIGADGTVYIGSNLGCLHAFGKFNPNAPSAPEIIGPNNGKPDVLYEFTFKSESPLGNDLYYCIDWGDNKKDCWLGPYPSGHEVTVSHLWLMEKAYTIKARVKDAENLWGPWEHHEFCTPRHRSIHNDLLLRFLEKFPVLKELLSHLIKR